MADALPHRPRLSGRGFLLTDSDTKLLTLYHTADPGLLQRSRPNPLAGRRAPSRHGGVRCLSHGPAPAGQDDP
jgi:hypothetical protein